MVSYGKLTKAEVLATLYNHALPRGLGIFAFVPGNMSVEEAERIVAKETRFDYVKGRCLKVDLSGNKGFEEWLYDREYGQGTAQKAVDEAIKARASEDASEQ
jgi:hypothetical protein